MKSSLRERLERLIEHAASKTPCGEHYRCLLVDLKDLLASQEQPSGVGEPQRCPICSETEKHKGTCSAGHGAVQASSPGAAERKVGNRFVIRNNDLVKIATGEAIPEWEPLFLFRARDYLALPALLRLREAYVQDGCTEYLMALMDETIEAFRRFQVEHPEWMKQPGVTQGKVFTPPSLPEAVAGNASAPVGEGLREAYEECANILLACCSNAIKHHPSNGVREAYERMRKLAALAAPAPKPAPPAEPTDRQFAYRFLELPHHEQWALAKQYGVFSEADGDMPDTQLFVVWIKRLRERGKLSEFQAELVRRTAERKP